MLLNWTEREFRVKSKRSGTNIFAHMFAVGTLPRRIVIVSMKLGVSPRSVDWDKMSLKSSSLSLSILWWAACLWADAC